MVSARGRKKALRVVGVQEIRGELVESEGTGRESLRFEESHRIGTQESTGVGDVGYFSTKTSPWRGEE